MASVAAAIVLTQGVTVGAPGVSQFGVAGSPVVVSNGNDTHVINWRFVVLAAPPGSAVPVNVPQDGPSSTFDFSPDLPNSYLVELTVTDAQGNTATDVRCFAVKLPVSGRWIPPFMISGLPLDATQILNFPSEPATGWANPMDSWLGHVESIVPPWGTVTSASAVALPRATAGAYKIDSTANAVGVTVPAGPVLGDELTIRWDAGANPTTVNRVASGVTVEDPYNPGSFPSSFVFKTLGDSAVWKYAASPPRFLLKSAGIGSGGGTSTALAFVQPELSDFEDITVADATVLAKRQYATFAGTLFYLVTNIVDNVVTVFNGNETNATGSTVAIGATVAFGGSGAQVDATALKAGDVHAIDPATGRFKPSGHRPVNHLAYFGGSTASVTNAQPLEAMFAACTSNTLDFYIPQGTYGVERPVFLSTPNVRGGGHTLSAFTDAAASKILPVGTWTGPTLLVGTPAADPVYVLDGPTGEYMMTLGPVPGGGTAACINLSSFDGCSLNNVPQFNLDINYKPIAQADGDYVIASSLGSSTIFAANQTCIRLWRRVTAGVSALHLTFTAAGGQIAITSSNNMTLGAVNNISIKYNVATSTCSLILNGTTTTGITTGNVKMGQWERLFIGQEPGVYMGTLSTQPGGTMSPATGDLLGCVRLSFFGLYFTTPNAITPVYPMAEDSGVYSPNLPDWTSSTRCTAVLIDFSPANRSTTICGKSGYVVALTNVTRNGALPRSSGYTVWLSTGGENINYISGIALHSLAIGGRSECARFTACPRTVLRDVFAVGLCRGITLDVFSYFSIVEGGGQVAAFNNTSLPDSVFDAWALGLMSEGIIATNTSPGGGNWAVIGSGGLIEEPYCSTGAYGCILIAAQHGRSCVIIEPRAYNETVNNSKEALIRLLDCPVAKIMGGIVGTVGGTIAACIQIEGGVEISFEGTAMAQYIGQAAIQIITAPTTRPAFKQCSNVNGPWLDPANAGNGLQFDGEIANPRTITTTTDANYSLPDIKFWNARTLVFQDDGSHPWTTGHTVTMPFFFLGMHMRIVNHEAQTMTINGHTIASGASLEMYADGTGWGLA